MRSINFFSVLLIISAIVFLPANLFSRVSIGSTDSPQDFSVLELFSNETMGLRLPQLTTIQRDALTPDLRGNADAKGLLIFNTTYQCVETWSGDEWISLCWGETPDPCAGLANLPDPVTFCNTPQPTIADLTAEVRRAGGRGTIEWFTTTSGGNPLPDNRVLTASVYFAGNCAGATARIPVRILDCSEIIAANIRVTAFVNVLYDFQTQRLETWTTSGGEATSVQWQFRIGTEGTWTDIAGATSTVYTLPANFIHRMEFANDVNYLYFRTVMSNPVSPNVVQSDNFMQIRFIRTTQRDGSTFLPGFGRDANGVRYATMSRAAQTVAPTTGNTIRVALLNVGATDDDGVGLGNLFQWGRTADGHERIVWSKPNLFRGNRNNIITPMTGNGATSATIPRPEPITILQLNYHGQVDNPEYIGRFITGVGDWGVGATRRNDLWGNTASTRQHAQNWTTRAQANNPCPPGWRIPSRHEFNDMHRGDGSEHAGSSSSSFPIISNGNTWTWRDTQNGAVGGVILDASTGGILFLSAGQWREGAGIIAGTDGNNGRLWTSTFNSPTDANLLAFGRSGVETGTRVLNREIALPVRCVAAE